MDIRVEQPHDAAAVAATVTAAFADDGSVAAIWSDVTVSQPGRIGLVAVASEEIVGHIGLSHCWIDARRNLVDALVLSPLSVSPARQRQGIGTALIAAALRAAEEYDAPAVVLEGDPSYYARHGFVPGASRGLLAPSDRTPPPAFQVALLPAHEKWMTGRVVYPELWWRHDAAGLRDPELAKVEAALGGLG